MKTLKNLFFSLPWVPTFFSLSFILTLFFHNIGKLSLKTLKTPVILSLIFSIIFSLFFRFLMRNKIKGNLFSSLFIILFFSYGEFVPFSQKLSFITNKVNINQNYLLLPVWIFLLSLAFFLLKKTSRNLFLPHRFLLVASTFAILLPLTKITLYEIKQRLYPEIKSPLKLPPAEELSFKNILPDIYYLLPDSYSASWVLENDFKYNNRAFADFLEAKGFYIASRSASNYPKTFLSLASTLNMEYLDYLSVYKNSSDLTKTNPLIEKNNVMHFLKGLGYHYYQAGSWWEPSRFNRLADDNFILEKDKFGNLGEFNHIILNSTMLGPLMGRLLPKSVIGESDKDRRKRSLYQFKKIPEIVGLPSPKFVFIHILVPHEPYVFGRDCEFVTSAQIEKKNVEENYINQVNCLNQKLEKAINTIINNSSYPPVILLQSDEGAPFLRRMVSPEDGWGKASPELLKKKFPILSAYYLPGVSAPSLYPFISPVNSFRLIFNLYFSAKLPLLPDRSYIFADLKHPYDFKDITEKLSDYSSP